jgi:hypothetical protein
MKQCSATTRATAVIVGPVGRDVEVSPASYVVSEDATTLTRLGRTTVRNRSPQAAEDDWPPVSGAGRDTTVINPAMSCAGWYLASRMNVTGLS